MLLYEPPAPPASMSDAAQKLKEELTAKALALEPAIAADIAEILGKSVAYETGVIVPSNLPDKCSDGWVVRAPGSDGDAGSDSGSEGEGEGAPDAGIQLGMDIDSDGISSIGPAPSSRGGTSRASVAGRRGPTGRPSLVGPVSWFPQTTVFARRDSLLGLMHDKSITDAKRKSLRLSRSAGDLGGESRGKGQRSSNSRQGGPAVRKPDEPNPQRMLRHHVKEYSKLTRARKDQQASFYPEPEKFDAVDSFTKPLRDMHLSDLRERPGGIRPENLLHNATVLFQQPGPQVHITETMHD